MPRRLSAYPADVEDARVCHFLLHIAPSQAYAEVSFTPSRPLPPNLQEAQAAASLASVLLMVLLEGAPALLEASLRGMAAFVAATDLLQQAQGGRSLQVGV